MDLPHPGHLARVLAVASLILVAVGAWARGGAFREDGRRILVMGILIGLLTAWLATVA